MNTNNRASGVVRGAFLLLVAGNVSAQTLEQRVARAPEGAIRFSFAARPGVYGNGRNMISWDCHDGNCRHNQVNDWGSDRDDWTAPCDSGPVRVALTKRGSSITELRVYVGGAWRSTTGTDLGTVSTRDATSYLLSLARADNSPAAKKAIFPAMLADSVTLWPELLKIARDANVSRKVRSGAVFWLGQAAGDAATKGLTDLVDDGGADREVRETAVFALSQRPKDEGVPILIRIARQNPDAELRRKAIFWLGQSDDPRALSLFEELLTRP